MRIRTKLTAGFLLVILSILFITGLSLSVYSKIDEKCIELREEIKPNIVAMMQLYNAIIDLHHWSMTYALYGQEEHKQKVESAIERTEKIGLEHLEHEKLHGQVKQMMAEEIIVKVNK